MADFIQLRVKRRQTQGGFLDLLHQLRNKQGNEAQILFDIRQNVERWLILQGVLDDPPGPDDRVSPFDILSAAHNRVCEIAGHAWVEFVKDASDDHIHTGSDAPLNYEDLHLVEFIPEPDINLTFEVFGAEQGASMLWQNVTAKQIVNLFEPMLRACQEQRREAAESERPASGCVKGSVNYLSPDQQRESPHRWLEDWFEKPTGDRVGAYVTPIWQVALPKDVQGGGLPFYSFTPEHYERSDNCITWAARVLDRWVCPEWLDIIRERCGMAEPQCGKAAKGVAPRPCRTYHVKQQGRVKCLELYVKEADAARIGGLTKFTHDRI